MMKHELITGKVIQALKTDRIMMGIEQRLKQMLGGKGNLEIRYS